MKRTLTAVLATLVLFAVAACAPLQPGAAPQTPEAIAKQLCPSALIALTSIQALDGLSSGTTKTLTDISKVVTPVCDAVQEGTFVGPLDLKAFSTKTAPVLMTIVHDSNMNPDKKNRILLEVNVAQIAIASLP